MANKNEQSDTVEDKTVINSDIRTGYQAVTNFVQYEGRLSWNVTSVFVQFGILLIAAAVFPSFIGTTDPRFVSLAGLVISIIGLVASIMWWSMVARTRRYYQYWLFCARELEQYMCEEVKTFERGYDFAVGGKVTFRFPDKADTSGGAQALQFKTIERIKMTSNFRILYGTFTGIFIVLLCINLLRVIAAF